MHVFLSVLLWVLLGLLALLVLLLVVPAVAAVTVGPEGLFVRLWVLGIPFRLYPFPQRKHPKKPRRGPARRKKAPEPQNEPAPAKRKKLGLSEIVEIVSTAGKAMRLVLRGLWVFDICAVVPVQGASAAETAIAYGRMQAYVHGGVATLRNFLHLRFRRLQVVADFEGDGAVQPSFSCKIGAEPFIMVLAAIWAFVRLSDENII